MWLQNKADKHAPKPVKEFEVLLAGLKNQTQSKSLPQQGLEINENTNWELLVGLSKIHRVTPLIWNQLKQEEYLDLIPPATIKTFTSLVQSNVQNAMLCTTELAKLIRYFAENHIRSMPIKGTTLAFQFYESLASRHVGDIDLLLIDDSDIWRADQLVQSMGYQPQHIDFELSPRQKQAYLETYKDLVYIHKDSRVTLELHYGWSRNKQLFPYDKKQVWENSQGLLIANTTVQCLDLSDHLLYLLVHGSNHQWFRLKWLCDIPLIFNHLSPGAEEHLFEKTRELGIQRMVLQGLVLSKKYLGIPSQASYTSLENELASEKSKIVILINKAEQKIISMEKDQLHGVGFFRKQVNMLGDFFYSFELRPELRYKWLQIRLYWTKFSDWKLIKLPDSLFFLYYFLRIFTKLKRDIRKSREYNA